MAVEGPYAPVMLRCRKLPLSHPPLPSPLRPLAALPPHTLTTERHGGVRTLAGHMGCWGAAKRIAFICRCRYMYIYIYIYVLFFCFCKCDGWYFMSINYNAARLIERGLRKHHTAVTVDAGVTDVSVNTPCEASQRSSESETRREWHELLSSSLPRTSSGPLLFCWLAALLHFAARELRVSTRRN
jgi:hypothetical protein